MPTAIVDAHSQSHFLHSLIGRVVFWTIQLKVEIVFADKTLLQFYKYLEMMDGNDASQELGATFLSSDSQLFVQSDGDGKTRKPFLYVIQCDDILF